MPLRFSFSLQSLLSYQCPKCRVTSKVAIRSLTTTWSPKASVLEQDMDTTNAELPPSNPQNARIVPASPSYFSGNPDFTDRFLKLQSLLREHQTLPTVPADEAPRVAWRTITQFRMLVGETVRSAKYHRLVRVLQRLNLIHPAFVPKELAEALQIYKRDIQPNITVQRPAVIDEDGRAVGIGRRKSSSAKVYLVQGEGEVLVNGKSINSTFGRIHDRESALWALKATQRINKYNVWALVRGGGLTGQAEAITLGTARALLIHEPALKPALRRGKLPNSFSNITPPPHFPLSLRQIYLQALHQSAILIPSSTPQRAVSRAIPGESKGKSQVMSRLERCQLG